jgi:hypothetical protein
MARGFSIVVPKKQRGSASLKKRGKGSEKQQQQKQLYLGLRARVLAAVFTIIRRKVKGPASASRALIKRHRRPSVSLFVSQKSRRCSR